MTVSNSSYDTFLAENGLDYTVNLLPQSTNFGDTIIPTKGLVPVRMDTLQALNHGGISTRYNIIQNRDAFAVLKPFCDFTNSKLANARTWSNGLGAFVQVSMGTMKLNNGDSVEKYITIVNQFTADSAMKVLITPYRMVCQNQITRALKNAKSNEIVSLRHTASISQNLENLMYRLDVINGQFIETEQQYVKMQEKKITVDYVEEAIRRFYPEKTIENDGSRSVAIRNNLIDDTLKRFHEADGIISQRDTVFNLYNALQGTTQHKTKQTATHARSTLFGNVYERSVEAMDICLDLMDFTPMEVLREIDEMTA